MKKAAILMLGLALAVPAIAAEEKKAEGEGAKKGGKPGTNVDMPYVMAPLTDADGKLMGYAYISLRLTAASESLVPTVREKVPFIQDAFVRDVNDTAVAPPGESPVVDILAIEARFKADAAKVMGPGKVKMLTICTVQIAPLHPVQNAAADPNAKPPASRCDPA